MEKLIEQLNAVVAKDKLIIWIHGKKCNYLVPAVSVSMNGQSLQIEGDPTWMLDSEDSGRAELQHYLILITRRGQLSSDIIRRQQLTGMVPDAPELVLMRTELKDILDKIQQMETAAGFAMENGRMRRIEA